MGPYWVHWEEGDSLVSVELPGAGLQQSVPPYRGNISVSTTAGQESISFVIGEKFVGAMI